MHYRSWSSLGIYGQFPQQTFLLRTFYCLPVFKTEFSLKIVFLVIKDKRKEPLLNFSCSCKSEFCL